MREFNSTLNLNIRVLSIYKLFGTLEKVETSKSMEVVLPIIIIKLS